MKHETRFEYLYAMPLTEGRSHWPQSWQKAAYATVLSHALRHASEVARTQPEHTAAWEFKARIEVAMWSRHGRIRSGHRTYHEHF